MSKTHQYRGVTYCNACGNCDCPIATATPYWRTCPAVSAALAGHPFPLFSSLPSLERVKYAIIDRHGKIRGVYDTAEELARDADKFMYPRFGLVDDDAGLGDLVDSGEAMVFYRVTKPLQCALCDKNAAKESLYCVEHKSNA